MAAKRSYGTGSLFVYRGKWYGQWRVDGRLTKRVVGPMRLPGTREGLTKSQAERELRRMIEVVVSVSPTGDTRTVREVGEALIAHLTTMGRKPTTISDYRSYLRVQLVPFFGDKPLDKIGRADVQRFIASGIEAGKSPKSVLNWIRLLSSIFEYAMKREWVQSNPCRLVDKPRAEQNEDIRFLTQPEIEALLRKVPDDDYGQVEKVMYLAATMTGMRQGELRALRWQDIDWLASRVRVRRNYVRGEYGTPKSRRSSRSVPLADRLAGELERHYQASAYQADDDLVFCHPHTGNPIDNSKLLKRFKDALKAAGLRELRWHDLRHSFATRMAAAGVPMRTLQEWMGHRNFATTLIYADYSPSAQEAELIEAAFGGGHQSGHQSEQNSGDLREPDTA